MKKSFLRMLVIILTFLTGCCREKDRYQYIPESNRPVYSVSNKLIYKSNQGILDTFIVIKANKYLDFTSYEGKCKEKGVYTENMVIYFSNKLDSYYYNGTNSYDHSSYNVNLNIDGFFVEWLNNYFLYCCSNYNVLTTVNISGKSYDNVHLYAKDTAVLTNDKICKIYFNKKYGVLYYEFKNGIYWELQ